MPTKRTAIIGDPLIFDGRIIEMASGDIKPSIDVPVDPRINIDVITSDDSDPMFVNVEVTRTGKISGNNRRFTVEAVNDVNSMTPGLQGFLGHPDPGKVGFEFRKPQCIYVGSMIDNMDDGNIRCVAKCYIFKSSDLREWIPKSIAAGNPMTVSVNGYGDIIVNSDGIMDVVRFNDLQSIDWANPGTEGMSTSKAMSIVSEMNNNTGGNDMEKNDIIKDTSITEYKAFNPNGYTGLIQSISVTELREHNPALVKSIEDAAKITEMTLKVDGKDTTVKISEMQGVVDGLEKKVNDMITEQKKSKLEAFKKSKIEEMVPENLRDKISARISGETEEAITECINNEIAYIREMGGMQNLPNKNQQTHSTDELKDSICKLFGVKKAD